MDSSLWLVVLGVVRWRREVRPAGQRDGADERHREAGALATPRARTRQPDSQTEHNRDADGNRRSGEAPGTHGRVKVDQPAGAAERDVPVVQEREGGQRCQRGDDQNRREAAPSGGMTWSYR